MEASSQSWVPAEVESVDDDNFIDVQGDMNSSDLQVDDHDGAETSSQETPSASSDEFHQMLIDLSALVPGSNKIDEVSVISKTIQYLKELHETIAFLEDKGGINPDDEVPSNKQPKLSTDEDVSDISSNSKIEENTGCEIGTSSETLTEIEARFLDNEVLVRIHCMKSNELVVKILGHLRDLRLSVIRNSALHFGDSHFEIMIIAQIEDGFMMTEKELIRSLGMAIFPSI